MVASIVRQAQPLAREVCIECDGFRIAEQPVYLLSQHTRVMKLVRRSELEELLIRHRTPQEIGESIGQRKVIEFRTMLAKEQKVWRNENPLQADSHRLFKAVVLIQS